MRALHLLLAMIVTLAAHRVQAQYHRVENTAWALGNYAGLDFSSGSPVVFESNMSGAPGSTRPPSVTVTAMASASVCDAAGNLLFYTNGSVIWDRDHNLMANASPLHNRQLNSTPITQITSQGALIVPVIDDPDRYYVFSLTHHQNWRGVLYYSVVDMRLNGGMGDVVPGQKWIPFDSLLSDVMIAVPGNNCNVWLITHARDTNRFHVYNIDASGLNPVPARYTTGSYRVIPPRVPNGPNPPYYPNGFLSVSIDGRKLAMSSTNGEFIELFRFDPFSGSVSGGELIDSGYATRSVVFSPDGSRLYATSRRDDGQNYYGIYQYETDLRTAAAIRQSKTLVSTCLIPETHLKLAIDEKIYFINGRDNNGYPSFNERNIGVIAAPDQKGSACLFDSSAVVLEPDMRAIYSFSAEIVRKRDTFSSSRDTLICGPLSGTFIQTRPGFLSYRWNDDSASASRAITERGTYWVEAWDGCLFFIDTIHVLGGDPLFELGEDIIVCSDPEPVTLHIPLPPSAITWPDGSSGQSFTIHKTGTYRVESSVEGCRHSDTIRALLTDVVQDLGPDTVICVDHPGQHTLLLQANVPASASVMWSTGSSGKAVQIRESDTYWVTVTEDICTGTDTISVTFPYLRQDLGPDTSLCSDQPADLLLQAHVPAGAAALWSDGSTGTELHITDTGVYHVTVRQGHCADTDHIRISSDMCDCIVFIPDAFSPNGDGRNDLFRPTPETGCPVSAYSLQVFNRWGQLVYDSGPGRDPRRGWNGDHNGAPADVGTYMYQLRMEAGSLKNIHVRQGTVVLIR